MMNHPASGHRQPPIMLGTPDYDRTNRAALWALAAVAFVFLLCILAYAVVSNNNDGAAASAAQATVVTIDDWSADGS